MSRHLSSLWKSWICSWRGPLCKVDLPLSFTGDIDQVDENGRGDHCTIISTSAAAAATTTGTIKCYLPNKLKILLVILCSIRLIFNIYHCTNCYFYNLKHLLDDCTNVSIILLMFHLFFDFLYNSNGLVCIDSICVLCAITPPFLKLPLNL